MIDSASLTVPRYVLATIWLPLPVKGHDAAPTATHGSTRSRGCAGLLFSPCLRGRVAFGENACRSTGARPAVENLETRYQGGLDDADTLHRENMALLRGVKNFWQAS